MRYIFGHWEYLITLSKTINQIVAAAKNMGSEVRLTGFKSRSHDIPVILPWTSYLSSIDLNLLIQKIIVITVPISEIFLN